MNESCRPLEMSQIMHKYPHFSPDKLSNLSGAKYGSKPEQWKIDEDCKFSEATCTTLDKIYWQGDIQN